MLGSRPQQSTQLHKVCIRLIQTVPDGPVPQKGVLLRGHVQAFNGLISPHIHGTDDNFSPCKQAGHLTVGSQLLLLGGWGSPVHKQKFRAEQANALRPFFQSSPSLLGGSNVGVQGNPVALCILGGQLPVLAQQLALLLKQLAAALVVLLGALIRVYINMAQLSVHCNERPFRNALCYLGNAQHRRNFQRTGQNCRMAGGSPCLGKNAHDMLPVHAHRHAGGKFLCHQHACLGQMG